jgi:hypothetical protein
LHIVERNEEDNPVADHLSRMENIPNDLIPISDSFSNEQLANINMSSIRVASPWFGYYANFLVGKVCHHNLIPNKEINSFMILDITFGTIFFCIRKVWMVLLGVVCLKLNNRVL